jgi:hypothetical protein
MLRKIICFDVVEFDLVAPLQKKILLIKLDFNPNARISSFRVILNSLDPVWNESYRIEVCHSAECLSFEVRDKDHAYAEFIGAVYIPVVGGLQVKNNHEKNCFGRQVPFLVKDFPNNHRMGIQGVKLQVKLTKSVIVVH